MLATALSATPAAAASTEEILQSCQIFLRNEKIDGDTVFVAREGLPCWMYLSAIQDVSMYSHTMPPDKVAPILGSCLPAESTETQLIRIFVDYAQRHLAQLHKKASYTAILAFAEAFPCP
jgi:Rap1a immunity proteins